MAVVYFKAYYRPPEGVEREITNLLNFQQSRGLELKSSKADLVLKNSPFRDENEGESIFQEDGTVEIYADYLPITRATNQLLLSGQIRQINFSAGENGAQTKLTVADRTVLLLGSLQGGTFKNKTSAEIIKTLVQAATEDGNGNQKVTTTNVSETDKDGGSLKNIVEFRETFKPLTEIINELSQPARTGDDRPYQFYVDTDNDLHWFYPSQTSNGDLTYGVHEIFEYTINRSSDDVVNMVIYNAGPDLKGDGVLWYFYDTNSKTSELRMKFFPFTDLSKQLFDAEVLLGNLVEDLTGSIPYPSKGKLYSDGTYNFTTSWGESVANFNAYNQGYRNELKSRGDASSRNITTRFGKLLWKGNVVLKGTNQYKAGDLLTVTLPSMGSVLLRVQDVTHNFQKGGWATTLEIKEDEATIVAN